MKDRNPVSTRTKRYGSYLSNKEHVEPPEKRNMKLLFTESTGK